jgi:hypothetical protein
VGVSEGSGVDVKPEVKVIVTVGVLL